MLRFTEDDFVQPIERNPEAASGLKLPDAERLQVFLEQDLAGRNRRTQPVRILVIVFDADFVGMSVLPAKRHAVLLIDPNAVTARLITLQQF